MIFPLITTEAKKIIIHITSQQSSNHCSVRGRLGGGADAAGSLALADRLWSRKKGLICVQTVCVRSRNYI